VVRSSFSAQLQAFFLLADISLKDMRGIAASLGMCYSGDAPAPTLPSRQESEGLEFIIHRLPGVASRLSVSIPTILQIQDEASHDHRSKKKCHLAKLFFFTLS
jgi:hypothetical protein